jgi:hypothetical protein
MLYDFIRNQGCFEMMVYCLYQLRHTVQFRLRFSLQNLNFTDLRFNAWIFKPVLRTSCQSVQRTFQSTVLIFKVMKNSTYCVCLKSKITDLIESTSGKSDSSKLLIPSHTHRLKPIFFNYIYHIKFSNILRNQITSSIEIRTYWQVQLNRAEVHFRLPLKF